MEVKKKFENRLEDLKK
jgi:hypothetical protein